MTKKDEIENQSWPTEGTLPPDIDTIARNLQIVSTLAENQKLKARIAVLESEYQKLANLVADWYLAPEDTGFSPETLALQNKARWLSETPVSAWLP